MGLRYNNRTGNFEETTNYYDEYSDNNSYSSYDQQNDYQDNNSDGENIRCVQRNDGCRFCIIIYQNGRRQRIAINYPHCLSGENDAFLIIIGFNNIEVGPKPRTFIGPYEDWVKVRGGGNRIDTNHPHVIAKIALHNVSEYYFN